MSIVVSGRSCHPTAGVSRTISRTALSGAGFAYPRACRLQHPGRNDGPERCAVSPEVFVPQLFPRRASAGPSSILRTFRLAGVSSNRGDWIRTSDRPAPSRVRYQTAPLPVASDPSLARDDSKRATGIEPALEAWKASVQPQHFARRLPWMIPAGIASSDPPTASEASHAALAGRSGPAPLPRPQCATPALGATPHLPSPQCPTTHPSQHPARV